jgi:hypothetical protein
MEFTDLDEHFLTSAHCKNTKHLKNIAIKGFTLEIIPE